MTTTNRDERATPNLISRFLAWWRMTYHQRRGCDGKPFHNGMCECECRTHYLGL